MGCGCADKADGPSEWFVPVTKAGERVSSRGMLPPTSQDEFSTPAHRRAPPQGQPSPAAGHGMVGLPQGVAEAGYIERVQATNLMCHKNLIVELR